jgi:hypothetical protein
MSCNEHQFQHDRTQVPATAQKNRDPKVAAEEDL